MTRTPKLIDGERIRKAHSVRRVEPIQERLAIALGAIPELRYIKIFPARLAASNVLSADGKKNPVVQVGAAVSATPEDWCLAVLLDWSGGFWQRMAEEYPRLCIA